MIGVFKNSGRGFYTCELTDRFSVLWHDQGFLLASHGIHRTGMEFRIMPDLR